MMSEMMDPSKMKVADLRTELQNLGLDTKGNKPALVERLKEALEGKAADVKTEQDNGLEVELEELNAEPMECEQTEKVPNKMFYGTDSQKISKYLCVSDDSESDDQELIDSGNEYLPGESEMSSEDETEERPAKKPRVAKKKRGIIVEEYPDEEDLHDELALQVQTGWHQEDIKNDPLPGYQHKSDDDILSPFDYFSKFVTREMIDSITFQTNLYAKQKNIKTNFITNFDEIMQFIGILLFMGVCQCPSLDDYWAGGTKVIQVAEVMSSKRFKLLRRTIHFNDDNIKDGDRYHKIRPLFSALTAACLKIPATPRQSIDDVMVGFKGATAGNLKRYMRDKRDKWGFKLFCRASEDGVIHDILMYQGTKTFDMHPVKLPNEYNAQPISSKVVLVLASTLDKTKTSAIYADNFFTSLSLVKILKNKYNCRYTGHAYENRCGTPGLMPVKEMEKKIVPRGTTDYKSNDGILAVRWKDNKVVTLLTNDVGVHPVTPITSYNKETKKREKFSCPAVIKNYNAHMGCIDKSDMLVHLYKTPMKSKRWYMRLFAYFLDLAVVNAWLVYRRDCVALKSKYMPLKNFRLDISISARSTGHKLRGGKRSASRLTRSTSRASSVESDDGDLSSLQIPTPVQYQRVIKPDDSVRYDTTLHHWPVNAKTFTCKHCSTKKHPVASTFACLTCKVNLCIKEKNCFVEFHSKYRCSLLYDGSTLRRCDENGHSVVIKPRKFTTKKLAEAFACFNSGLQMIEKMEVNYERFSIFERQVQDALACYKEIYNEKKQTV
nr:piggyBac transposable element-derived protein 3-like [Cherax quadricarinatus]